MAISDALAEVRAFVLNYADARKIKEGLRLIDTLEQTIDARVTELLAANNAEVERRRAAEEKLRKIVAGIG